mgnify:CR=1 FL=1
MPTAKPTIVVTITVNSLSSQIMLTAAIIPTAVSTAAMASCQGRSESVPVGRRPESTPAKRPSAVLGQTGTRNQVRARPGNEHLRAQQRAGNRRHRLVPVQD